MILWYIIYFISRTLGTEYCKFDQDYSLSKGNYLHSASTPKEVAYGAILSLKNAITSGGYLHSHDHLYPVGIGATQVGNKNNLIKTVKEGTN